MADNDTPETETEGTEGTEASETSGPTRRRSRRRNANKPAVILTIKDGKFRYVESLQP